MMKLIKIFVILGVIGFFFGCSKDEVLQANDNKPPNSFEVKVVEVTTNSARIEWDEVMDPNGDEVMYSIYINNTTVVENIKETTYDLHNLIHNTQHEGTVVASDQNGGETSATFMFNTFDISPESGSVLWQKSLGGSKNDNILGVLATEDNGYVVAGRSISKDGDFSINRGSYDCWLVKLDGSGEIEWKKNYGGSKQDVIHDIAKSNDGGYFLGAFSASNDFDVTENSGMRDFWVVKTNSFGDVLWKTSVGGDKDDIVEGISSTQDGGCVVAGYTSSTENGVSGQSDAWVVKLSSNGTFEWGRVYGNEQRDLAWGVSETSQGDFIAVGSTENALGKRDILVSKLNSEGELLWTQTFGGSQNDWGQSLVQTTSGEFIIGGSSDSNDGDIVGNSGESDAVFIKLDASGNHVWTKVFGGTGSDYIEGICPTSDGGIIATGSTTSTGDAFSNNGGYDFWIVKLDASANITWHKQYGGTGHDYGASVTEDTEGNFLVGGSWYTNISGEGEGETGDYNFWALKLNK
ncbi:fibronectin type III domain-containing protein [Tenacibaculum xiamenense]|uniref:fibronectin type III domain-containing protein n=1 Tax=Tenacibaculum xiamenense TaxID=1261553 RepID=UPI0038B54FFA